MLTEGAVKMIGAFAVATLLFYIFSNKGIIREGAKSCSKSAQNVAVTQQGEIDNINSNYGVMKAELEELKKQILNHKTEISYNEKQLKQVLAENKKDLPPGAKK